MSGLRRAAVALHALTDADQQWVLAELPANERATLMQYLRELRELGFSRDQVADLPILAPAANDSEAESVLWHATPAQMQQLFLGEPASLIATILADRDWPWTAGYLALLSPSRREGIHQAAIGRTAPAKVRSLLACCARRLADSGTVAPASLPVPAPSSLRRMLEPLQRLVTAWKR